MTWHIYSTLTNGVVYRPAADKAIAGSEELAKEHMEDPETQRILIHGGANIARGSQTGMIITPKGAITEVTDKQMDALRVNHHFNQHVKNGFIHFEKGKKSIEKGVKDLQSGDKSKPVTPGDLPENIKEYTGESKNQ